MSHQPEKIEEISQVQGTQGAKPVEATESETERASPNKEKFTQLVQQTPATEAVEKNENKPSPISVSNTQQTAETRAVTPTELTSSIDDNIKRFDQAKNKVNEIKTALDSAQLQTPGLALPSSQAKLLEGHLSHANENVKIALTSIGQESTAPAAPPSAAGDAINRFLGMLTHGQHDLMQLSSNMSGDTSGSFTPGQVLAVQIKMNSVGQQIEFFTSALSKVLESIKTIMNVQV